MLDLAGKTIMVTGASRGIGKAIVEEALAARARVVAHARRRPDGFGEGFQPVGAAGAVAWLAADLESPEAATNLWRSACDLAEVDVLVNNAGVYLPASDVDDGEAEWEATWQRTLEINLKAPARLCRAAIRSWTTATGPSQPRHIVNIASRAAIRGDGPTYGAYAASKAGLVGLTKTIARAHASRGIFAYALAPGFVRTDMAETSFADEPGLEARVQAEIPIGDIVPPVEVARMAIFLAAGGATHATGSTFDINGASHVR